MLLRNKTETLACLAAMLLALGSSAAHAQANPELGETGGAAAGGGVQADTSGSTGGQATWQPPTSSQVEAANDDQPAEGAEPAPGDTDHASVVGRFGVGFFGVLSVPVMGCAGAGCTDVTGSVSAPTIGIRYWLQPGMGIEAALGIGIQSGSSETVTAAGATTVDDPSFTAFALHGGLPLVFAESQHFAFELVPELNFGFATGSLDTPASSTDLGGMMFELGARVGAEIQFGFIDIPQLALQGTVGLHLTLQSRSSSNGPNEFNTSALRFGTSLQGEPWDIFTGGLTAIYYF
jgi:hypothetical protein